MSADTNPSTAQQLLALFAHVSYHTDLQSSLTHVGLSLFGEPINVQIFGNGDGEVLDRFLAWMRSINAKVYKVRGRNQLIADGSLLDGSTFRVIAVLDHSTSLGDAYGREFGSVADIEAASKQAVAS